MHSIEAVNETSNNKLICVFFKTAKCKSALDMRNVWERKEETMDIEERKRRSEMNQMCGLNMRKVGGTRVSFS